MEISNKFAMRNKQTKERIIEKKMKDVKFYVVRRCSYVHQRPEGHQDPLGGSQQNSEKVKPNGESLPKFIAKKFFPNQLMTKEFLTKSNSKQKGIYQNRV